MDKLEGFEFVLPLGEEVALNSFVFLHQDGNRQNVEIFQEEFCDEVVRRFVDFLRGCGYVDESVYSSMQDIAADYFKTKEKLRMTLPAQQTDLE